MIKICKNPESGKKRTYNPRSGLRTQQMSGKTLHQKQNLQKSLMFKGHKTNTVGQAI